MIVALLAVAYFVYFPDHKPSPVGQLTTTEQTVMTAASTEAVNLVSYKRASFTADFNRALAGTTGKLTSDVKAGRAGTLQKITQSKIDISATVQHTALVGPAESGKTNSYVVLVVLFGYTSADPKVPNPQNLQVTVNKVGGKWLASAVTMVTVS